jgi:hypothetical protein
MYGVIMDYFMYFAGNIEEYIKRLKAMKLRGGKLHVDQLDVPNVCSK